MVDLISDTDEIDEIGMQNGGPVAEEVARRVVRW